MLAAAHVLIVLSLGMLLVGVIELPVTQGDSWPPLFRSIIAWGGIAQLGGIACLLLNQLFA